MDQAPCYLHPRQAATTACSVCSNGICERCATYVELDVVCRACVADGGQRATRRRLQRWSLGVAVLGLLIGSIWWVGSLLGEPPATSEMSIAELQEALIRRPGDAAMWMRLATLQLEREDTTAARGALRHVVKLDRDNAQAHLSLGLLKFEMGDEMGARDLLIRARNLGSTDPVLAWTLKQVEARREGRLAERAARGRAPSAALREARRESGDRARAEPRRRAREARRARAEVALEERRAAAAERRAEAEEIRAEAWELARERDREASNQGCFVALERRGGSLLLEVEIEGEALSLAFDSGASITTLSRDVVEDLGLREDEDRIMVKTANGRAEMGLAYVEQVVVAGIELRDRKVAVCEDCPGVQGLFGLDLQRAYRMTLDARHGRVRVPGCED